MSSPLNYALRLLKNRLRSAWEIDQALARRGVKDEERLAVIEQLIEIDLINDQRFTEAWVHTRDLLAPRGEFVLQQELTKKGIDRDLIKKVLRERKELADDESNDQPDEETLARKLLEGKMRAYAHLAPEVRERRLISLLMRRGFSYDVAKRILKA
jgi:regulatory protein